MRRQGISLRSGGCDLEGNKPRLIDLKAKRPNNKITIYSQKYTSLVSTQSLSEEPEHIVSTMGTLKSDSRSLHMMSSTSQRLSADKFRTESSRQQKAEWTMDEELMSLIKEQIVSTKALYEDKIRNLLEGNSRMITDLQQILAEQQRRLEEKQLIIQKLLLEKNSFYHRSCSGIPLAQCKRLQMTQFSYLKDRVQDLEVKLKIIVQTLNSGDQETLAKVKQLEEQLVKYSAAKLAQLRHHLHLAVNALSAKLQSIQAMPLQSELISANQNVWPTLDRFGEQIEKVRQQIRNFSQRQGKCNVQTLSHLQAFLDYLSQKVQKCSSRRNDFCWDEDDQFFYPQSERVYERTDDYEHFQEDSDEQRDKAVIGKNSCKYLN